MVSYNFTNINSRLRAEKRIEVLSRKKEQCGWIIVLILLVMIGFPGQWCNVLGQAFQPLCRNLMFVAQLFLMIYMSGNDLREISVIKLEKKYLPLYVILSVFLVVSFVGTSDRTSQLIKCARFSVTILFAIWLVDNYNIEEILEYFYQATVLYVVLCLTLAVLHPAYVYNSEEGAYCWIQDAKNGGGICFVQLISFQMELLNIRLENGRKCSLWFYLVLLLQFVMMIMTKTLSAVVLLFIVAIYLFIIHKKVRKRNLGISYLILNFGLLTAAFTVLQLFAPVLELLGKDPTLTGRTVMWQHIIQYMLHSSHILTGYGYDHFWYDASAVAGLHNTYAENTWYSVMTTGAHNTILELWLNVGLAGVISFSACAAVSLWHSANMPDNDYHMCIIYMLTMGIDGVIERNIGVVDLCTLYLFMVFALGCRSSTNRKIKQAKKRKKWLHNEKKQNSVRFDLDLR